MQSTATQNLLTLADLLSISAAATVGDYSPLSARHFLAVDLTDRGAPLDDAQQTPLRDWLQRQTCPTLALSNHTHPLAPAFDVVITDAAELTRIAANIEHTPLAAMVLVQVLRATENLPAAQALLVESLAYATLQAGPEFKRWAAQNPPRPAAAFTTPPLLIERDEEQLTIRLNRPERRNAISVEMRDALYEALQLVSADTSIRKVNISGNGNCFSIGGDVDEFGTAPDAATAHAIRSLRLPANLLVQCADRVEFHVHSACIGAGIEIPAFAQRVTATRNAFFQLPEIRFGLIPGAGGTVSLPRRIGRQRTAYMALSAKKINAATALDWGLVDGVVDPLAPSGHSPYYAGGD